MNVLRLHRVNEQLVLLQVHEPLIERRLRKLLRSVVALRSEENSWVEPGIHPTVRVELRVMGHRAS